jgi:hypothetical protein
LYAAVALLGCVYAAAPLSITTMYLQQYADTCTQREECLSVARIADTYI